MDSYEYDAMLKDITGIQQDETHPRVKVSKHLADFKPTSKVSVPSGTEMLVEEITGSSDKEVKADVAKVTSYNTSLNVVDVLDQATDIPSLFSKAQIEQTDIATESRKVLRKGVAEIPTAVGAVPTGRRKDTTNTSTSNPGRRAKLRQMFVQLGPVSAYSQQQIESILDAMEAFMDNQIQ